MMCIQTQPPAREKEPTERDNGTRLVMCRIPSMLPAGIGKRTKTAGLARGRNWPRPDAEFRLISRYSWSFGSTSRPCYSNSIMVDLRLAGPALKLYLRVMQEIKLLLKVASKSSFFLSLNLPIDQWRGPIKSKFNFGFEQELGKDYVTNLSCTNDSRTLCAWMVLYRPFKN